MRLRRRGQPRTRYTSSEASEAAKAEALRTGAAVFCETNPIFRLQQPRVVAQDLEHHGRRHVQIPSEDRRSAPAHEGTVTAMNGHWSIHAIKGLANYNDGGSYEVNDTAA